MDHRYSCKGKAHWAGIGSAKHVTLQQARIKRDELLSQVRAVIDPIEERRRKRSEIKEAAQTFRQVADAFIAKHEPSWKNPVHRAQWRTTLQTYAYPVIGNLPVDAIEPKHMLEILTPIWHAKPETARRVRGRMEQVLDYAAALKMRDPLNPARMKGNLQHLFPGRSKSSVKHHPAMPYTEVPDFMLELRQREGIGSAALEFLILTAGRTGEVLGATWSEIRADVWTVPAARMKAGREHRVPLTKQALAVLDKMREIRHSDFVFPGTRGPISNMSLLAVLARMGRSQFTAHGFRSSFRDWAAEKTDFRPEVVEAALAHTIPNAVEAAYRRTDLFDRRRELMMAWSTFCDSWI
jgi:integrase